MAYLYLPPSLADLLAEERLKLSLVSGWQHAGRPPSVGNFAPTGVLIHHTAGPTTGAMPSLNTLIKGRSDLPGPLAQIGIGRDGTVHLIAAGRANHAGRARPSGPMPGGDGNALYVGIEAENTGTGEPWTTTQLEAMERTAAVLCRLLKVGADHVRGHKETSTEGKIDPAGINMDAFRRSVAILLKTPTPSPQGGIDVDEKTLRKIIREETLGARFREFVDQNENDVRDRRTVSDILYSTHAAVVELSRRVTELEQALAEKK